MTEMELFNQKLRNCLNCGNYGSCKYSLRIKDEEVSDFVKRYRYLFCIKYDKWVDKETKLQEQIESISVTTYNVIEKLKKEKAELKAEIKKLRKGFLTYNEVDLIKALLRNDLNEPWGGKCQALLDRIHEVNACEYLEED